MLYPEYDALMSDERNGYDSPTVLYRYFGATGDLLYVGIARDFEYRDQQHMMQSKWRAEAAIVRVELYPVRRIAESAEDHAIVHEDPVHNVKRMKPTPPGTAYNWYLYKMGGLRGELPRWATLGYAMREYPAVTDAPIWWDDSRLFSMPYTGKPAQYNAPRRKAKMGADPLANIDWRRRA